ncbi:MAG: lactate dehydrogenase [Bacilli bacterium]|nr:lactate dehydrogenase [Bacilli bacterium]
MKIAFFKVAPYERETVLKLIKENNLDADVYDYFLEDVGDDVDLSIYDAVSVAAMSAISHSIIDRLTSCKLISFRTIGFNYLDIDYCSSKGIAVTNVKYDSYNVAEFTLMLMLIALRKAKVSICKALVNDFSLESMMGKELSNLTVGIIGTGNIGRKVIELLSGFKCKILCYDKYPNGNYNYVDLDTIYKECDLISLHCPMNKDNFHMIGNEEIKKMKDGVIIVNTARGALLDTDALIEGIETLKIGALALDTIEGEDGVSHVDLGAEIDGLAAKKNIMYLKQFPNVILTQHYGFFTEEAVRDSLLCSLNNLLTFRDGKDLPNKVN